MCCAGGFGRAVCMRFGSGRRYPGCSRHGMGSMVGGGMLLGSGLLITSSATATIVERPTNIKFSNTKVVEVLEQSRAHVQGAVIYR